jgi:hypothetical protein
MEGMDGSKASSLDRLFLIALWNHIQVAHYQRGLNAHFTAFSFVALPQSNVLPE